ncbi:MAG: TonB-dependent receptor plug domain-containing protein, partial [Planctomycetota bacterium]
MARWLLAAAVLAACAIGAATAGRREAAGGPYRGMPLAEALGRLQALGLRIIYSSDLVRAGMRVHAEPRAVSPREILDELLAPHGLKAREGPGGALLVVEAPARGRLRGLVLDRRDLHPLAGARIRVAGMPGTVTTDAQGRFETPSLPAGPQALEVTHPAHLPGSFDHVEVAGGRTTEVRLELAPRGLPSEPVVVTPEGSAAGAPEARERLDRERIERSPDIVADPLRALGRLPGVVAGGGAARLNIRGGAADEVQILLDGLDLYEPYHLKDRRGLFSVIDTRAVDRVDVLDGVFPAEYGGRVSGVVDIASSDPSSATATGLEVSSIGARLASEGAPGGGRLRWLATLRAGYPDALLDALEADPGYAPRYYDLFGKARWRGRGQATYTLHLLATLDELEGGGDALLAARDERETFKSTYADDYAWLTVERIWRRRLYARTILSVGSLARDRRGSNQAMAQVRDLRSTRILGLKQDWLLESGRHLFRWGLDAKRLQADYRYQALPDTASEPSGLAARRIARRPAGADLGAYLADRIRLLPRLNVELGLRWDEQESFLDKSYRYF